MAKKGQGLPLNLIVLAAIAALILVLVIAFTIGGAGAFFTRIFQTGNVAVGDQLSVVQTTCSGLCDQAKLISTTTAWPTSSFCARTFNIDRDGDGKLGCPVVNGKLDTKCQADTTKNAKGDKETGLKCADSPISATCAVSVSTPSGSVTCTRLGVVCATTDCA